MDALPEFCRKRVLILGCGNTLFGDDGVGPAVVDFLNRHYEVPDDVCLLDVGTGVRKVLAVLAMSDTRPEEIVVVDAVDWGGEPGQVYELPVEAIPRQATSNFCTHQAPTSNLLRDLSEQGSVRVTVLACQVDSVPATVRPGLSPAAREAVQAMCRRIAERYFG